MNEIVSFKKEIEFKTMINNITSISLEHTLMQSGDNSIGGDLIVTGTYKQTEASQIENPFSYKIPVDIEIDNKYNLDEMKIDIDDFTYDFDGDKLNINVDILLDNLKLNKPKKEEKEELETLNDLFLEMDNEEELNIQEEKKEQVELPLEESTDNSESLFTNLDKSKETYKTYRVYILRENDTLDYVLNKYNVSREALEEYNELNDIHIGSKLIIPNTCDE
ncbi:MAG: LysM peptidoglycan-binding domain-containing protein [Bacilli bacterium]|nr:LysM peptidoglycan-binding domain-containing protein [Bacilli bacterium]